eukprot:scaffold100848_cov41-Tisochrysis_lutea.AAC.1
MNGLWPMVTTTRTIDMNMDTNIRRSARARAAALDDIERQPILEPCTQQLGRPWLPGLRQ